MKYNNKISSDVDILL